MVRGLAGGRQRVLRPAARYRPGLPGPHDDHVIATALAVKADAIITGDKDLLALGQYQAVRILTARAFLTELENHAT